VNFILDADIREVLRHGQPGMAHPFPEHRIGDKRIIRLIQKWLKAGVLEDGIVTIADGDRGRGR
jgi:RNA-directed DNA polymerase